MYRCKIVGSLVVGCLILGALSSPARAEDNGVIKGKVVFKGDKAKYARQTLDTSKDPNCKKSVEKIGSEDVPSTPRLIRLPATSLCRSEGVPEKKYPCRRRPRIDQHGCQYKPHVLAMMEGQQLEIRNSDDTNHNIHFFPRRIRSTTSRSPRRI